MPVDVADPTAAERLAERAVAAFGRLDVWVNNAGVVTFGRFDEIPPEAFRRVIEINLLGYVHGARAALRRFREQGGSGVLINNASLLGISGMPYASAYVASKFAIRSLSACLRRELRPDSPGVHVCTVLPATMDTPIFRRGANYSPWRPRAVPPVYDPTVAAKAIVGLALRPEPERIAGGFGRLVALGAALSPGLVERAVGRLGIWLQFRRGTGNPDRSAGNLFRPAGDGWAIDGGWRRRGANGLLWLPAAAGVLAVTVAAIFAVRSSFGDARAGRRQRRRYR